MKINSFFCGAGGFDLGFIQEGFEIVGAYDFDKYAIESYRHNIGNAEQKDITEMEGHQLHDADGWTFGFPCQDISNAKKQNETELIDKKRSGLFYEVMRLLGEVKQKPSWILAENVKAVNKFIPDIQEEYDKAGYTLVYTMYQSKYENVPQNRERYFLLGLRKDLSLNFTFEKQKTEFIPMLSTILEKYVDEKYYMSNEKAKSIIDSAIERMNRDNNHKSIDVGCVLDTRQHKDGTRVYNTLSPTLTGTCYKEPKLTVVGMLDMKGQENIRRVYDPEGLAPTLTTSEGGHRQPKIIEEFRVRKLTPREYARLQSFPDSYEQVVSDTQFYKQMGNAVTVNVSRFIAKQIKEQLEVII